MRVANELGRGDAGAVKFSIKVVMGTSVTIGVLMSILCLIFSKKLGYLFTNDEAVVQSVDDLSLLLALTVFLGSIFPVLSGYLPIPYKLLPSSCLNIFDVIFHIFSVYIYIYIYCAGVAVGSGLQSKVAVLNLVCFYVIGLPVGAVLGYAVGLQVKVDDATITLF